MPPTAPSPEETAAFNQAAAQTNAPGDRGLDLDDILSPPQGMGELGRLGQYSVLKVLGAGGMGVVLHARDLQLERFVALKVMRPSHGGEAGRQRFLREARAAAAIEHDMLLDTCAAGAAQAKLMEHRDLPGDQVRAMDRLKDRTGFHVLMGCAADAVSYEASEYSQGLLTYSLLRGMARAKLREGEYVDVSDLFQYAADEVPKLARGNCGVQQPKVFAPGGTSFDIGRMAESDRKTLPLAQPKPLILRPKLANAEDGDDNLKLETLVRKCLYDDSFTTVRGVVTTVYVNADELTGAMRPAGTYTIEGKKVSVRLVLKQDGRTLNKVTVAGSTDDLPGLAGKLAEAIEQAVKKP